MDSLNLDVWSTDEVFGFFYGLNSVFVSVYDVEDKWEMITRFVKTKSYEEVVRFGEWYCVSCLHNNEPWTEVEHYCFMQGFELFGLDFIRINTFLPGRSLMNIHAYAMLVLPSFKHKRQGPYFESEPWIRMMSVQTNEPSAELVCNERVDWDISRKEESSDVSKKSEIQCEDMEPIDICDTTSVAESMDKDSMEFLFETLFD